MNYFKILLFLEKGNKSHYDIPIEKQKAFLNSFNMPKDDMDRGFFQYVCQNFFVYPKWKIVLFNVAAACLFPFMLLLSLLKGFFLQKEKFIETMIENKGMNEVIPDIVISKYRPNSSFWMEHSSLSVHDIPFLAKLVFRYPLHPYFLLKSLMNIVQYSDMIHRHSPKVMIQFGEFSFSSSILTHFCHYHGVKHIDIMHGEKSFYIRDSFFHYDECYVWTEHHKELFISLRAEPNQFIIAVPSSLKIDIKQHKDLKLYADYKYYLASYTEEQIKDIVSSMSFAIRDGKTVKYRPHPRYSDISLLKKYVSDRDIEFPQQVSIVDSLSNVAYAVGAKSTVLTQAYFSGINVVLDDLTFYHYFSKLKEMHSLLGSIECNLLSNLIK